MSQIVISADSTCDLPKELVEKYDIKIVPLYIVFGDESKKDAVEATPEDIYDYVNKTGQLTKTSAVPVGEYMDCFEKFTEGGKTLIHFSISSGFSSTHNNALLAAEDMDNVYVVDTRNLSTGSALVVLEAKRMDEEGMSAEEIVEKSKEIATRVDASFVICNLDYLRKGGRCSAVAAIGANILKLKPCIEVVEGKMNVGKKHRGTFAACLKEYVKERLDGKIDDIETNRIFVTHTKCDEEIVNMVVDEVKSYGKFDEIVENVAGGTVTSHCGPETLGILYIKKSEKKENN